MQAAVRVARATGMDCRSSSERDGACQASAMAKPRSVVVVVVVCYSC